MSLWITKAMMPQSHKVVLHEDTSTLLLIFTSAVEVAILFTYYYFMYVFLLLGRKAMEQNKKFILR